jgi:cellulose synthase/poly-beta-1,6-N-acetylglucosamine synthase-like glycosyltransferase
MTTAAPVGRSSDSAPWVVSVFVGIGVLVTAIGGVQRLVDGIAVMAESVFIVYFVRHLLLAVSAMQTASLHPKADDIDGPFRPRVSVLVACKDEAMVIEGLVESLLALEYPSDRLQVVVVNDGSTDGTGAILETLARTRPRLKCLHRSGSGGKPSALNDGLALVTGEVIVVFDADHRPHRDVVKRLIRHFEDPAVAAVQGRCVISNAHETPVARLVAVDYLAGYLVNEYGRQAVYQLPAYGGANCAVRTVDLWAIGGWNPNSVTEDTDLTIRLILAGRRVRYDVSAVDEEEAVVSISRYWKQRYRWARGHQKVWRDYRRGVWSSSRLSIAEKVETTLFLLAFHVPVVSALGLVVLLLWLLGLAHPHQPIDSSVLWTLLFLGPLLELGGALLVARADRREAFALLWFLPMFFVSIALCTKAWVDGIAGRPYSWVKTKRSSDDRSVATLSGSREPA